MDNNQNLEEYDEERTYDVVLIKKISFDGEVVYVETDIETFESENRDLFSYFHCEEQSDMNSDDELWYRCTISGEEDIHLVANKVLNENEVHYKSLKFEQLAYSWNLVDF
jgi:hypothetical protein